MFQYTYTSTQLGTVMYIVHKDDHHVEKLAFVAFIDNTCLEEALQKGCNQLKTLLCIRNDELNDRWPFSIASIYPLEKLYLKGTPFQIKVWESLYQIPLGKKLTYSEFSKEMGYTKGVRAIAHAIARNPISFFIPCHRIGYASSMKNKMAYRWGSDQKKRLLRLEEAHVDKNASEK